MLTEKAEGICKALREAVMHNKESLCAPSVRSITVTVKLNASGAYRVVLLTPTMEYERNGQKLNSQ